MAAKRGIDDIVAAKLINASSSFVIGITTGMMNSAIDAVLAPTKLKVIQGIWQDQPIILPDVASIMNCHRRQFVGLDLAKYGLTAQGVNFHAKQDDAHQRNALSLWDAVWNSTQELPSLSFIMDVASRGYFEGRQLDLNTAITRASGEPAVWNGYLDTLHSFPAVGDAIEARNRDIIGQADFETILKRQGFGNGWVRDIYDRLRDRLPGASDLVHFAVKEAFSVDIANALRLYDEFPDVITPYMKGQGLGWNLDFQIIANGNQRQASVADLYWAAHWQPISLTQAISMFHIYRPNRMPRYAAAGINVVPFGIDDVRQWARINDYPPTVRDQLVGLSFTPLRLVDIRHALTLNYRFFNDPTFSQNIPAATRQNIASWNRAWGIEQFRDRGVLPEDAAAQVDMVITEAILQLEGPSKQLIRGATRAAFQSTLKAYRTGLLSIADATTALRRIGLSFPAISTYLSAEDAERQITFIHAAMRALRRAYLSGVIGFERALAGLREAGIPEVRATEEIVVWQSEFNLNRRQATTQKVLSWVAQGLMTADDARQRLTNLGWSNPDLALHLAEAQGKALVLRARAIRAADMDRRRRTAELDKIRREQIRNVNSIQQALRRATPVATLQRWLRKGQITQPTFVARMVQMGYDQVTAAQYAKDAVELVPVATLQRWLRKREISEATFRQNLAARNLTPETIDKYVADALTPEPQRIYPKIPADATTNPAVNATQHAVTTPATPGQLPPGHPLPITTETIHVAPTQTQVLNTQPEQLHTQPGQLGGANPPAGQGGQ